MVVGRISNDVMNQVEKQLQVMIKCHQELKALLEKENTHQHVGCVVQEINSFMEHLDRAKGNFQVSNIIHFL